MPVIVHTADIHLGTPFAVRFSRKQAELRRNELKATFSNLIEAAGEAELLLISGDLFDGSTGREADPDTVSFLKRRFAEIPNVKVFIAAGNHDPYLPGSVYAGTEFGSNVHVFGTELEYVDLPDCRARVHGVSFDGTHDKIPVFDRLELSENFCNILVIHGDTTAIEGAKKYNPITRAEIEASGLDYIALGHIHRFGGVEKSGGTYWAYPGIPEGRGFDETGAKGVLTGRVEKGSVELSFSELCRRRLHSLAVDASAASDLLHLCELTEAAVREAGGAEDLYQVKLTGRVKRELQLNLDVLTERFKEKTYYIEFLDQTTREYQYQTWAEENSLRGRFVSLMMERIERLEGDEKREAQKALEYGVESMIQ